MGRVKVNWKPIDELTKKALLVDEDLHALLRPTFPADDVRTAFIAKCLTKLSARRMLLRAQWYAEIADGVGTIRHNRPGLKIIFLVGLAEGVAKLRDKQLSKQPFEAYWSFLQFISQEDKAMVLSKIKRAYLSPKYQKLRFKSIARILFEIRNKAVHGEDYYSFSLRDANHTSSFDDGIVSVLTLTKAALISKRNKRSTKKHSVSLDISMTYEELRDIFVRTAIANIQSVL